MNKAELTDNQLELVRYIQGDGNPFGHGLLTHPRMDAPVAEDLESVALANQVALHAACLDLERLGYLYRLRQGRQFVFWMAYAF